jgi:hypothetical protein
MSLTVEDGTGLATADSYLSVADADAYFVAYPNALWTGTATAKEHALRAATLYIDTEYGGRWKGIRANEDQALDWPRWWVEIDGYQIEPSPLPDKLKKATAELAVRALSGELQPDIAAADNGIVTSESDTVGPLSSSKTYGAAGKSLTAWYRKVDALLCRLLMGDGVLRA